MIKPHHPVNRYERIKLSEKKEKNRSVRDPGHVRKRIAVEHLKETEAQYEIEQLNTRVTVDGIS